VRTLQSFLGRPFLATAKAIIYADTAKIVFTISGRKEIFNFKNKILKASAHPDISHPIFQRKPSAYLYACQDQVSCI
jgi:hypothetical protein